MSSPSIILNSLTYAQRKSLAGLVAVALPADDLADGDWNMTLLEDVLAFLDLDKELAQGFFPMTERGLREIPQLRRLTAAESWEQRVEAFRTGLPPAGEKRLVVLRDLMVIVALQCGYDARTRVTFRRVCDAMQVPWHPSVSEVESTLARKVYERVNRDRERELRGDRWRGFKIGAAMIGGGAILAVSGGLAAPAVAAGIAASSSLIGASAAATLSGFATTAWMATLFGATGAGLVGYKMDRRTKGVQEFEFESETSIGEEMCVSICVPGIIRDKADLQRAWGVEPRGPDVSAKERLRRFYYVYNREKVDNVEDILKIYKGKEASLCRRLAARYGADPRDPLTREALAKAEGRELEGVSKEELEENAEIIGQIIEAVLKEEKDHMKVKKPMEREAAQAVAKISSAVRTRRGRPESSAAEAKLSQAEVTVTPHSSTGVIGSSNEARESLRQPEARRTEYRGCTAGIADIRLNEKPLKTGNPARRHVASPTPPNPGPPGNKTSWSAKDSADRDLFPGSGGSLPAVVAAPLDASHTAVNASEPEATGEIVGQVASTEITMPMATAVTVSSPREPCEGELLREWGVSGSDSNKAPSAQAAGSREAPKKSLHVLSYRASGAADRVVAHLSEETVAEATSSSDDGVLAWAEAALRRCDGDESRAVEFIEGTSADEMEAFVQEDAEEERARKEREDAEKYRVWFWQDKLPHTDQYVLRWETKELLAVGKSVENVVKSLSSSAMQETLKYTTLATLMTALTWPLALISLTNMIDTDWTIGRERADIAGKILADALLNREQGCRPVTLVGTSLGARLIFACLEEIARRQELWEEQMVEGESDGRLGHGGRKGGRRSRITRSKGGLHGMGIRPGGVNARSGTQTPPKGDTKTEPRSAAGVIENVVLLGVPVGASSARWERVARVVHGRLINGFSKSDMILGLVFRARSLSLSVAGVQKVTARGVENEDLTSLIGSDHFKYNRRMPEIMSILSLDDCSKYIAQGDEDPIPTAAAAVSRTSETVVDDIVYFF